MLLYYLVKVFQNSKADNTYINFINTAVQNSTCKKINDGDCNFNISSKILKLRRNIVK